jgi:peptidoglycan/xylan/chitin deacetylase (PgdA/CDA1 family)
VIRSNVDIRSRDVLRRIVALLGLLVAVGLLVDSEGAQGKQQPGLTTQSAPVRRVAITVDDLPGAVPGTDESVGKLRDLERDNRQILHVLAKHKVPAIGFVIEAKLQVSGERDARAGLLEKWIDAGMELGNHTYSHVHFDDTSLEKFEDETVRGEGNLAQRLCRAHVPLHVAGRQSSIDGSYGRLDRRRLRPRPHGSRKTL